jgi:hypothetical protein
MTTVTYHTFFVNGKNNEISFLYGSVIGRCRCHVTHADPFDLSDNTPFFILKNLAITRIYSDLVGFGRICSDGEARLGSIFWRSLGGHRRRLQVSSRRALQSLPARNQDQLSGRRWRAGHHAPPAGKPALQSPCAPETFSFSYGDITKRSGKPKTYRRFFDAIFLEGNRAVQVTWNQRLARQRNPKKPKKLK